MSQAHDDPAVVSASQQDDDERLARAKKPDDDEGHGDGSKPVSDKPVSQLQIMYDKVAMIFTRFSGHHC